MNGYFLLGPCRAIISKKSGEAFISYPSSYQNTRENKKRLELFKSSAEKGKPERLIKIFEVYDNIRIVKFLKRKGREGFNYPGQYSENDEILAAIANENFEVLKYLFSLISPSAVSQVLNENIIESMIDRDFKIAKYLLALELEGNPIIDIYQNNGYLLRLCAVLNTCQYLVLRGLDINSEASGKREDVLAPLAYAAMIGDEEVLKILFPYAKEEIANNEELSSIAFNEKTHNFLCRSYEEKVDIGIRFTRSMYIKRMLKQA